MSSRGTVTEADSDEMAAWRTSVHAHMLLLSRSYDEVLN